MYEVGDKVIETIGPDGERMRFTTHIVKMLADGRCQTTAGNWYTKHGMGHPGPNTLKKYRSIIHKDKIL